MKQLLFILLTGFCFTAKSLNNSVLINSEPEPCVKSYTIEISGDLNEESAKKIREYILTRKGICQVTFDFEQKTVTLFTSDKIDEESVKYLVLQARINFVNPEQE